MSIKYKCLYEITGRIEDVNTFLVPLQDLPKQEQGEPVAWACWLDSQNPETDKPVVVQYEPLAYSKRRPLIYTTLQHPKQEPVAWAGYNLDDMCDAFDRVIEEHHYRKNPFHDPVNRDAMLALRILRGFVPYMKRYTTPPQRKPMMLEKFREMEALLDNSNAPQHKTITDDELKIIMETTMPVIDWKTRYGVELNNGERNKWMLEWFIAFARAIEAAHGIKGRAQPIQTDGREHEDSKNCWCSPTLDYKDPDTGNEVWIHNLPN